MKKYILGGALVLFTIIVLFGLSTAHAGFSSRGGGGGFSSGGRSSSYSAPSRSYSTTPSRPSYTSPAPVYRSPTTSPTYRSPNVYRPPATVTSRPTVVEHHYYGGGYGGGFMSNPFFWLWAMDNNRGYGGIQGGYATSIAGGGIAPGAVVQYVPTPIWLTLTAWLVFLVVIGLLIWGLSALWRWSERSYYD